MKEIITITNHKGGSGKTTTSHAIGTGLHRQGYKTLLIDLDAQSNLTFCTGIDKAPLTSMEVMTRTATAQEATLEIAEGLSIIPASPNLAGADTIITEMGKEYRLREALAPLQNDYDYIIIDTPPALNTLTVNALTTSDSVIIPAQADTFSLQGIGLLYDTLEAVRTYTNPELKIKGILLTRYNKQTILSRDMKDNIQKVADFLGTKIFETPIRESVAVREAQATQQSLYDYAPRNNATADYTRLIEEILEE